MGGFIRSERALGVAVILAAACSRTFDFWATNGWNLRDPTRPLLVGAAVALIGLCVYALGLRLVNKPSALAITVALVLLITLNWRRWSSLNPVLLIGSATLIGMAISRLDTTLQRGISGLIALILGLVSVVQMAAGHLDDSEEIPISEPSIVGAVQATGVVEDVLVVVVDSYPSIAVAEKWYGHDSTILRDKLMSLQFRVPEMAWSQHTYTSFAIPALLQLQPVVEAGAPRSARNFSNLSKVIGGDNIVADSLRSAGFEYFHIESGSEAGSCYDVDICLAAGWLDEATWQVLQPTIFGKLLKDAHQTWMVPATLNTHTEILGLRKVFGDGKADYIFAHLMLPHAPYVVDANCQPIRGRPKSPETRDSMVAQLRCVDELLQQIASIASDRTAVIITGDHGAKSILELNRPPEEWTKQQIIQAFGVFLAYRLPDGCDQPRDNVNTVVMASIMGCAVGLELPSNRAELLIGLENYRWVGRQERQTIETQFINGNLAFIQDEVLGSTIP